MWYFWTILDQLISTLDHLAPQRTTKDDLGPTGHKISYQFVFEQFLIFFRHPVHFILFFDPILLFWIGLEFYCASSIQRIFLLPSAAPLKAGNVFATKFLYGWLQKKCSAMIMVVTRLVKVVKILIMMMMILMIMMMMMVKRLWWCQPAWPAPLVGRESVPCTCCDNAWSVCRG